MEMRQPMEFKPDPRVEIENAHDRENFEQEARERAQKLEDERLVKMVENQAKHEARAKKIAAKKNKEEEQDEDFDDDDIDGTGSEGSASKSKSSEKKSATTKKSKVGSQHDSGSKAGKSGIESDDQEVDDDIDDMDDGGAGDLLNQNTMKRELIQAILDERAEYEQLKTHNEELQKKIILSETIKQEQFAQSDQMMSDHKYLNTLANVHQVRFNLKDTQDRYNRMASELQAKLNEKQAKC